MSFIRTLKQKFVQLKTNHGWAWIIKRYRLDNGEYTETLDFVPKKELPEGSLNIANYGKDWYYWSDINPILMQEAGTMSASNICTWADNNDLQKALQELWSWTNNIDFKKVLLIVGVAVVGMALLFMIR